MLTIYGVAISVHTRKVIFSAEYKGLDYNLVRVVPVDPSSLPASWDEISLTGKIPVITDGDYRLSDSAAICAYLEKLHPQPSLYPTEARAYGQTLWLEQYAGVIFAEVVRPLFHETFVHPRLNGRDADAAVVEAALSQALPKHFGHLETAMGQDDFVIGPAPTIADISIVSNLLTFGHLGFELDRVCYPRLAALQDRITRLPTMRRTLERERLVVQAMGLDPRALDAALAQPTESQLVPHR